MKLDNSYNFDGMKATANKQFTAMKKQLGKIESNFASKIGNKTNGKIILSLIGTGLWVAAFVALLGYLSGRIEGVLVLIAAVAAGALLTVMIIDHIMNFSYYGKISSYRDDISRLEQRVSMGQTNMVANQEAYLATRSKGWDCALSPANSIPEEATAIEKTVSTMESVKSGFLQGAKNVLYYAVVIATTVVGSVMAFGITENIMVDMSNGFVDSDSALIWNIVALLIIIIAEIIFAKFVWGKTDCSVTNVTLFSVLAGPIAFVALVFIVTLLIYLIVGLISLILAAAGFLIVGACLFSSTCGG